MLGSDDSTKKEIDLRQQKKKENRTEYGERRESSDRHFAVDHRRIAHQWAVNIRHSFR